MAFARLQHLPLRTTSFKSPKSVFSAAISSSTSWLARFYPKRPDAPRMFWDRTSGFFSNKPLVGRWPPLGPVSIDSPGSPRWWACRPSHRPRTLRASQVAGFLVCFGRLGFLFRLLSYLFCFDWPSSFLLTQKIRLAVASGNCLVCTEWPSNWVTAMAGQAW